MVGSGTDTGASGSAWLRRKPIVFGVLALSILFVASVCGAGRGGAAPEPSIDVALGEGELGGGERGVVDLGTDAAAMSGWLRRKSIVFGLLVLSILCAAFIGGAGRGGAASAPSIAPDQASYAPGDTVALSGDGWVAGETVHVTVDDASGDAWIHVVDLTAAARGTIADSLSLPRSEERRVGKECRL